MSVFRGKQLPTGAGRRRAGVGRLGVVGVRRVDFLWRKLFRGKRLFTGFDAIGRCVARRGPGGGGVVAVEVGAGLLERGEHHRALFGGQPHGDHHRAVLVVADPGAQPPGGGFGVLAPLGAAGPAHPAGEFLDLAPGGVPGEVEVDLLVVGGGGPGDRPDLGPGDQPGAERRGGGRQRPQRPGHPDPLVRGA
jgi:hypothetical protein